jgi:hypothetical protein
MTGPLSRIATAAVAALALAALGAPAFAQGFVEIEPGIAFTGYNDVRIPSDTGTKLSLATDSVSEPALSFRVRGGYTFGGRHTVMALVAPLTVRGTGTLDQAATYRGHTFPAGTKISSSYRFDSYRLTYRYAFVKEPGLSLAAGLTAKIRSADIALMSSDAYVHRSDLGAVPLVNAMAEWNFAGNASLLFDADALWSPYGRAEDLLAALQYRLNDSVDLRLGYRVLEGGSDGGGSVYTFALFHYATVGMRVRF